MCADPEPLANPAAMPIGGDQILRPHQLLLASVQIPYTRDDTLRVLLHRDELGRVTQLRAQRLRMTAEDRLDTILARHAGAGGTQAAQIEFATCARRASRYQRLQLAPRHRFRDVNGEILERVAAGCDEVWLKTCHAQQLHAA